MKKKMDPEEKLVYGMMEHFEIHQPEEGFTNRVMDRVNLEPMPLKDYSGPLISRSAWILIGLILSTIIIFLLYYISSSPVDSAESSGFLKANIPDINTLTQPIIEWVKDTMGVLTWYTLGLVSLFILTVIDHILKRNTMQHGFVL